MSKQEKVISAEALVPASLTDVWDAWTTEAGIRSFFAPACDIDIRPDGKYEILFDPAAPPGQRGGEGMRVMAVQAMTMLSFTWNAPPHLPEARKQRTHVIVRLQEEAQGTRVKLWHDGWGSGGEWDQAFRYFDRAWNDIVLPRLKYRFEHGSIDWNNPPQL